LVSVTNNLPPVSGTIDSDDLPAVSGEIDTLVSRGGPRFPRPHLQLFAEGTISHGLTYAKSRAR
jgi:hypothetical protein